MTIVDNYFPFDTGPGATATAARWRLMARLWSGSGVVAGYLSSMTPSIGGGSVTIQPGAVWIDGYYGEVDSPKSVSVSSNGQVVLRMDPSLRQILLVFVASQTVPTQNLTGIFEVPIMQVTGGGTTGVDIRQYAVEAGNIIHPGTIWEFGGSSIPVGWLLCDGTAYSRTTYAALFAAIGTTWGPGDGSTTFNVPPLVDRLSMGAGTTLPLGHTGGSTIIGAANLPPHAHSFTTGNESAPHDHSFPATNIATFPTPGTGNINVTSGGNNDAVGITGLTTGSNNVHHTHSGSTGNGPGSSTPYLPPAAGVTKMIKT